MMLLAVLASGCDDTEQSADGEAILRLINEKIADTEICLTDREFHFPDVIVGPKYSGKGLAQLDALVSASLLRETEEVLSEPKYAPKYVYHYRRNHLIERKTFYLTDRGVKYYRRDRGEGYFCYGRPADIQLVEVGSAQNDRGDLVLNATFSYDISVFPDASWTSNPWIQREFPQASWGQNRQTARQQFIKHGRNSIKPVSSGLLTSRYW